ncbi:putative ribonuclease H-like domain-containing protein [Tanacetum coccineum]
MVPELDPDYKGRGYRVIGLWGKGRGELWSVLERWYGKKTMGKGFRRGKIDKTLFIKKIKNDILLVQVYVDDIIFGSTKESLSTEFEQLMHKRFQMSSIGELNFFLGLLVEQRKDGIFLSLYKYVYDILKKFGFSNVHDWIIDVLNIFQARHYVMFCAAPRFQDSPIDLIAYSDSDYVGASIDRKSTIGGCQFLSCRLISWQCKKQTIVANSTTEAEYIAASNCCG